MFQVLMRMPMLVRRPGPVSPSSVIVRMQSPAIMAVHMERRRRGTTLTACTGAVAVAHIRRGRVGVGEGILIPRRPSRGAGRV
jgi:hypothetical protein